MHSSARGRQSLQNSLINVFWSQKRMQRAGITTTHIHVLQTITSLVYCDNHTFQQQEEGKKEITSRSGM